MKRIILLIITFLISLTGFSQLTQDFEGAVFPPPTWAVFDNGINASTPINWATRTTPNTGLLAAYMDRAGNIGINQTSQDYLATPAVTVPANGQLKFFTRSLLLVPQASTKYQIRIKPVSAGAQNDPAGYALVQEYTDANLVAVYNIYEQKTINIPAIYTGIPVYVAFCLEYLQPGTSATGNRWLVDDVNIVSPCISPALGSLTVAPIFATSATLGWATTGAASYDIEHILSTGTFTGVPTGNSTTNSFVQNGLLSLTGYQYQVRANCGNNNFGPWIGPKTYVTTAAPPACGGNFVDNGGAANYNNNTTAATGTTTICPTNTGDKVTVTFNTFDTEATVGPPSLGYDGLYVYDGNTALSTQLSSGNPIGLGPLITAGAFWGTTIPGPFTSTSPDGCLTFVFLSDITANRAGWTANVTCAPPPACQQPTALLVNNVTATTAQLSWTSPGVATTWEVFVLPATAPAPLPTATGFVSTTTNSYNATLLSASTNYVYYVRGNCGAANGVSLWSGPKAFTTLATCPQPTISTTPNTVVTTTTSATLNWTEVGTATVWHIYAIACGGAAPTAATTVFTTVTTNPGTISGLTAGTCYDFYVRSFCSPTDSSLWSAPQSGNTQVLPPVCGGNFVDNGGLGGSPTTAGAPNNYLNSSNQVTTICPDFPGDVVTVNFTAFNTEANWDALYVYEGTGINPLTLISSGNPPANVPGGLAGGFWGIVGPGIVTSTSTDGCLTFVFRSDASVDRAGWNSLITCGPRPTCAKPKNLITSAITSTSATLGWTQPANFNGSTATEWQVIAVPCGAPVPSPANTAWINTTSNPYTFSSLASDTCFDFYVKAICSPTEISLPAGPKSGTTLILPPGCNQNFYDIGGLSANYPNGVNAANPNSITTICPGPGQVATVTFSAFDTEPNFDGLYVYDGNSINATQLSSANPAGFGGLTDVGAFWGTAIPGPFTSSSPDGCLTFRFISDGSGQRAGWTALVTCTTAPTCSRPFQLNATSATLTTATLGWTQLPNPDGSLATAWEILVLPFGSPVPTGNGIPTSNPYQAQGLTPGTAYTYYVRAICSGTSQSLWSSFNFATIPLNDDCANAQFAVVNQNLNCVQTTPGTIAGATASNPAVNCPPGVANDDVWFTFTATTITHIISFNNVLPATTLNYAIFQGNSCGALTQVGCNSGANLVAGTTYYIRVYSTSALPQFTNFNLCIGTLPCTEAPAFCTGQTVTYANSVNVPSLGAIGCLITTPNPAFFFLQVNQAGPLSYLISQVSTAGVPIDVDYVAWGPFTNLTNACTGVPGNPLPGVTLPNVPTPASGCPGTLHACSYSAAPTEIMCIPNAQLCEVYVVMITNYNNALGTVTFSQTNTGGGTTACFPINTFNYSSLYYCKNDPNPTPIIVAPAVSGTYSATPAGLVIDPVTGTINLAASLAGTYIVTSTTLTSTAGVCAATIPSIITTRTVIITAPPTGNISYSPAVFCNNISVQQPAIRVGTANGTYSSTPSGLSINPSTGAILPVASAPGIYNVTYTVAAFGGCPTFNSPSFQVEILALPNIIQPVNQSVCTCYTLPVLAVGNYYSQPGGLGAIIPGGTQICTNQTIYIYATNGICNNEKSFTVTVGSVRVPDFGQIGPICYGSIAPTLSPTSPNLIPGSWNPSVISNTASGTYLFTPNTICDGSQTLNVVVNPTITPVTGFSYAQPEYCTNGVNPSPIPAVPFTTGGIYTTSPNGLSINATTGTIDLCSSAAGTYTVTYTVPANNLTCTILNSSNTQVIIKQAVRVDSIINYNSPTCQNSANQLPQISSSAVAVCGSASGTITPTTIVGTWSASPVTSPQLNINPTTGEINFTNSIPGNYIITYTVSGNSNTCVVGSINTINLVILPLNIAFYPQVAPICKDTIAPALPTPTVSGIWFPATIDTSVIGIRTYTFTPFGPCAIPTSMVIEIIAPNIVPQFAQINPVCKDTTAPLFLNASSNTTPINGTWSPATINSAVVGSTIHTFTPAGGQCAVPTSMTVEVKAPDILPTFATINPICKNQIAPSLPTASNNSTVINGSWNPATISTSIVGSSDYKFTPAIGQCAKDLTISVVINELPMFGITGNCQGGNYTLDVVPQISGATYKWTDSNAPVPTTLSSTNSSQVVGTTGTYFCEVTNVNGCKTKIPFAVTNVVCDIQKGISPNGDGRNDKFDLSTLNVKQLEIYNRYGLKVFGKTGYTNEWEGQSESGVALPDGTYYYVAELGDGNTKTGWIYINKETN
jgi:gliding motility-associated-like protein